MRICTVCCLYLYLFIGIYIAHFPPSHIVFDVTWKDGLHIPRDGPVNERVEQHHDNGGSHGESVVGYGRRGHVMELYTDSLLLIPASNVRKADTN